MKSNKLITVLGVVCALTLVGAAVALAAAPVKGGKYSGTLAKRPGSTTVSRISFAVSTNGKKVSKVLVPTLPVFCQGGGFGTPVPHKAVKITKKHTFKVTMAIVFAPTHQNQGTLTVTGRFLSGRRAKGTVTTEFKAPSCGGSLKYTAKAPRAG